MPWESCEMHRETIQDEVKRLWDRLQYLADTVADLRERNTRKEDMESGKDQRPERRGQREATGTTEDSLMGRMARLEWMMERVMHACNAIEELEETAKLALLLRGIGPRMLTPEQVQAVVTTLPNDLKGTS